MDSSFNKDLIHEYFQYKKGDILEINTNYELRFDKIIEKKCHHGAINYELHLNNLDETPHGYKTIYICEKCIKILKSFGEK